uniref:Uncharacterized protein n=1 Tax=Arundo donax TaxID=35708 RepID=A0A0A8Z9A9_ARUDO
MTMLWTPLLARSTGARKGPKPGLSWRPRLRDKDEVIAC